MFSSKKLHYKCISLKKLFFKVVAILNLGSEKSKYQTTEIHKIASTINIHIRIEVQRIGCFKKNNNLAFIVEEGYRFKKKFDGFPI